MTGLGAAAVAEHGPTEARSGAPSAAPATFYVVRGGNDVFWRVEAPAKAIGAKAVIVPERDMVPGLLRPNTDTAFPWTLLQDANDPEYHAARYPEQEGGAAVWTRPSPAMAVHAAELASQGVLAVSEVDDNYFANPRLNIFQRQQNFTRKEQKLLLRALASAQRIVFSTGLLRDMYVNYLKQELGCKTRELPPLFVCRNNVDVEDWPEPVPRESRLRVGWMGSQSHIWDVDPARPALMQAKAYGCEVVMIGYNPCNPWGKDVGESWPGQSRASRERIRLWKQVGFRHIPWVAPHEGTYHRTALPLDIGLCPLVTNEMTLGKSDVKAIEYGISGAAVIAQNNDVYNRTLVHGETALLVNDPQEMVHAVDILVHDEPLRMRLVNNLRRYIFEERGLGQLRAEWLAAVTP